jgi:HSP20 family molecular chaperone IbpA
MSRVSPFNSPLMLGFDQLERMLDRLTKSAGDGFPPYNILQLGENRMRITLAVAGFAESELSVTVEGNQIHIRGAKTEGGEASATYLYRGIAARQFHRTFLLADGIDVGGATLENGLLNVDLTRPVAPEQVRTIPIAKASPSKSEGARVVGPTRREPDSGPDETENAHARRVVRTSAQHRSA